MKEALVSAGPTVQIVDSPVPKPEADQVVIKVVVSGTNPKDWKVADWVQITANQGDDIAGIVHEVGENVVEFRPGDRVAAFHEMLTPNGSYAEYAVAWQHTTFHLPKNVSFEEAATIPLASMTAAMGLYLQLQLPLPWLPATEKTPLIVYGAASAVGSYVLQLARRSNIHPLICVAGKSSAHVEQFLDRSQGDKVIDYRQDDEGIIEGLKRAADGAKLLHAFDAVSEKGSFTNLSKVLEKGSKLTLVLPGDYSGIPEHIQHSITSVGWAHAEAKDFGFIVSRYVARGLQEAWFKPQPHQVVPGGLNGVETALKNLKEGKANAFKYVVRISETEGVN